MGRKGFLDVMYSWVARCESCYIRFSFRKAIFDVCLAYVVMVVSDQTAGDSSG